MLGLFYPETNERYMPFKEFSTLEEVIEYMGAKPLFSQTKAFGEDLQAWLNQKTGDMLVVRSLTLRETDPPIGSDGRAE